MRLIPTFLLALSLPLPSLGCETSDPTFAVVDNGYPAVADGGDPSKSVVVYRAWWRVTVFPDPVAGGAESDAQRVVTGSDTAYLVLAPGWDPSSGSPPTTLLPAMTDAPLFVARGDTLHIQVDDAHVTGNCAAGKPLQQGDADRITQDIFPGEFAGVIYDARSCAAAPLGDGGSDSGDGE